MKLIRNLFLATCLVSAATAQPVINFAGNAASYDETTARGSMVVLFGTGLGPSPIQVATSFPLLTTFLETSVKVTVNGVTTDGIMYYVSDLQTAFVLDSDTPAGVGTVTLTYNGQTSAPFPITVVDSHLGFYTYDASGAGPGVVTFHESVDVPDPFPSNTNAVNPGDLVILWANGLGPVPFDETIGAEFLDMTDVPVQLLVNGQQVETIYRGRSPGCCTSVDNLFFYWPEPTQAAAITTPRAANSCGSTISAQIGDRISNVITVPSADVGTRTCSDLPDSGGGDGSSPLDRIITQEQIDQLIQAGEFSFAFVALNVDTSYTGGGMEHTEGGVALFAEVDQNVPEALNGLEQVLGSNACTTDESTSSFFSDFFDLDFQSRDAGPRIDVNAQGGQATIDRMAVFGQIVYTGEFSNGTLGQGAVEINSPGGPDVGPFTVAGQLSGLNWTNREQLRQVVRSSGFTATWSGPASGWVTVSGETSQFNLSTFSTVTRSFSCTFAATQNSGLVPGNVASFVGTGDGTLSVAAFEVYPMNIDLDVSAFVVTNSISQDVDFQ